MSEMNIEFLKVVKGQSENFEKSYKVGEFLNFLQKFLNNFLQNCQKFSHFVQLKISELKSQSALKC